MNTPSLSLKESKTFKTLRFFNPLNPAGWLSGLRSGGGPKTWQAGFPAFAMVCQKPEEYLNRARKINYKLICLHRKVSAYT